MEEKQTQAHPGLLLQAGHYILIPALSGCISFFALGFLQNFYPLFWQVMILAILLNIFTTFAVDLIFDRTISILKDSPIQHLPSIFVLGLGLVVVASTVQLLLQYPSIFSSDFFLPESQIVPALLAVTIISSSLTLFALRRTAWQTSPFADRIRCNLPGLLLATAITISTFALATAFNHPAINRVDNYFDTDSADWVNRLTARGKDMIPLRPVHPFAFLILRPPAWLLSIILNGDKFYAATLLNSIFGGICVYLTWLFFRQRTNNTAYALLIAALLGLSSSHLLLSVFLETYIFSAAVLIFYMFLLQAGERSLIRLVPVGLLTFGITITNFAQTCIAYFVTFPNIRNLLKYIGVVLGAALILAFAQKLIYPSSEPFYVPSNMLNEHVYGFNPFHSETRLVVSRANVLLRDMFLMNIVAPRPLILLKEAGCTFPCFQTIFMVGGTHYRYASYIGFGSLLARIWFVALAVAGFVFIRRVIKLPQQAAIQIALAANILFNFVLHMNYGDDPILYSPDWTYALVFFFGISYEGLANRKWFQAALLIFIIGLFVNNLGLFQKMLDAIAPFV